MQRLIQIILTILGLNSVSKVVKRSVYLIASEIDSILKHVQTVCHSLYNSDSVFKLSSGYNFESDLLNWAKEINSTNQILDFKYKLLKILESTESKMLRYKVKPRIEVIQNHLAVSLYKHLEKHLGEYVVKEISEIKKSLQGDVFFNLTNDQVPKDLTEKLNLGKKFIPYVSFKIKNELESFDYEVSTLFQNYLKAEFKVNINFSPKLLNKNLRAAHNFTQIKYNPKLRETIRHFEKIYNVIRKEFKVYLHSKSNNIYPKVIDIERTFDLSHDKIIIEADKNVGYVCIFKQDLLEQYAKINV